MKIPRPWCTCSRVRGESFNPKVGVFVHGAVGVPGCGKPTKERYDHGVRIGAL